MLKDSSHQAVGFRGVVRDITERRMMEEKIRKEEQRFRALAEQSSDIILMVNDKGLITYENSSAGILGIAPENRVGQDVFERLHRDDLAKVIESFKILFHDVRAPVQRA